MRAGLSRYNSSECCFELLRSLNFSWSLGYFKERPSSAWCLWAKAFVWATRSLSQRPGIRHALACVCLCVYIWRLTLDFGTVQVNDRTADTDNLVQRYPVQKMPTACLKELLLKSIHMHAAGDVNYTKKPFKGFVRSHLLRRDPRQRTPKKNALSEAILLWRQFFFLPQFLFCR